MTRRARVLLPLLVVLALVGGHTLIWRWSEGALQAGFDIRVADCAVQAPRVAPHQDESAGRPAGRPFAGPGGPSSAGRAVAAPELRPGPSPQEEAG